MTQEVVSDCCLTDDASVCVGGGGERKRKNVVCIFCTLRVVPNGNFPVEVRGFFP